MDAPAVVRRDRVAADLDAAVEFVVEELDVKLELEVAEEPIATQERVGAALRRRADDGAVDNLVLGRAVELGPTCQRLAVEEIDPLVLHGGCRGAWGRRCRGARRWGTDEGKERREREEK